MFNIDYDKLLWCILESDKENRKGIVQLLKSIPKELYEAILEVFQHENINANSGEISEGGIYFEGSVVAEDGIIYSYEIEYTEHEKCLTIKQIIGSLSDSNISHISFSTELLLVNEDFDLPDVVKEDTWIGTFTHTLDLVTMANVSSACKKGFIPYLNLIDIDDGYTKQIEAGGYTKENEIEYNLVKVSSGHIIRRFNILSNNYEDVTIDLTQMPAQLTMDYINRRYGSSAKIRKKLPPKPIDE